MRWSPRPAIVEILTWYSIRNASDPQIPNPNHDIEEASKQSALIYAKYGGLTTAASLIATWAIIQAGAAALPSRSTGFPRASSSGGWRPNEQ